MTSRHTDDPSDPTRTARAEAGSALLLAVFVLLLLTGLGVALLSASRTDVRASLADVRAKRSFFVAEAGLEAGREQVRASNLASGLPDSLDDELIAAAGPDGAVSFDPSSLTVTYDGNGRPSGITGYGDDVPVASFTSLGDGWYAAFLTNDPLDGAASLNDTNDRVAIHAVGAGPDRALEAVDAIVQRMTLPPLSSAITILGPSAHFDGGSSAAKIYLGDDCSGATGYSGVPGLYAPTVGVIGSASEISAEDGVRKPDSYASGPTNRGTDTVDDIALTIDPAWTDCAYMVRLAAAIRAAADYVCTASSPCSHWDATTIDSITYVDGDLDDVSGRGILWVTGEVTFRGNSSWEGAVFVVGKGRFSRDGGGNGHTWGGTIVANIAGPDEVLGTADDCSAPGGGFDTAFYDVNGGGTHDTVFCSDAIGRTHRGMPLHVVSFRQR